MVGLKGEAQMGARTRADINLRAPGLPLSLITKSYNVITVSDQSNGNGARNKCWIGCSHLEFALSWSRTS